MHSPKVVIPAKAGIQRICVTKKTLDSRFHENDKDKALLEQVKTTGFPLARE